ncbi:MAG: ribosomal protein [Pseudomonadota bacterium]|jgi:large subunit ribosomal protein L29
MKASDLKGKTVAELNQELSGLLKQQLGLRIKKSLQQLENTSLLSKVRKDIARVRTVLAQLKAQAKQAAQNANNA